MNPFPVLLIQRKFFNWLRIEAVIFAYNFLAAALGRRSEVKGLKFTTNTNSKFYYDGSSNIINYINFAPSPKRSCWGILERMRSSEDNYRSRFSSQAAFCHPF